MSVFAKYHKFFLLTLLFGMLSIHALSKMIVIVNFLKRGKTERMLYETQDVLSQSHVLNIIC